VDVYGVGGKELDQCHLGMTSGKQVI